jgi:hypothetical protein
VFPEASVAVQVTVVQPTGKLDPEGGLQTTLTAPQLSDAMGGGKVTTPVLGAGHCTAVWAVMSGGQVITGGCVSVIVTVKVQLA